MPCVDLMGMVTAMTALVARAPVVHWLGWPTGFARCCPRPEAQASRSLAGDRRGVAQPGSAPEWGSGGRRFKSSLPDQDTPSLGWHCSSLARVHHGDRRAGDQRLMDCFERRDDAHHSPR